MLESEETKLFLALRARGLKHGFVAKQCGIRASAFSGMVQGWRIPTQSEATAIARVLDVAVPELFDQVLPG